MRKLSRQGPAEFLFAGPCLLNDIYGANDEKFIEDHGRKLFLLYLKPIINGTGNYYIEAQTRDARRTDVIVDYLGEQFVVELKIVEAVV